MGNLYEEMDRAKEKIKANFNGVARSYNTLWNIIDQSSSGCERNWSAFERVHTKKRNRLKQITMNKKIKRKSASYEVEVEEIDSEDEGEEWIENDEDEEDEEDEGDDLEDGLGQEDASIGDVLGDDLELPPIDEEENGDLDDAVEVEENEDEDEDEFLDDYQDFGLENILNV
ncbi:hypothetical protein P8452_33045 [Trifolium repens]|nr:hypothetical protein P8452_33045 [Trifolium repens]